jgi:hypothetical protein
MGKQHQPRHNALQQHHTLPTSQLFGVMGATQLLWCLWGWSWPAAGAVCCYCYGCLQW